MRYKVNKTDVIDPAIASPEWDKAETGTLSFSPWKKYRKAAETIFKVLKGPEGISVLMNTKEEKLICNCTERNGDVCCDSCMEFFFKPNPWDLRYLNFEFNPAGVMHLGLGADRYDREHPDDDMSVFSVESIPNNGDWTLKFYMPDSFLLKYFDKVATVCRGNFYKCGDEAMYRHYAVWSNVEVPEPDFHLADFFGILEF